MKDVFVQLREMLECLGNGFPDVPEAIPYLKKIFSEEHAQVYIAMEDRFQPVEEVAKRLNRSPDEVKPVLDEMADKGLVFTTTKIEPTFYAPWPYLTGWGDWTAYYEDKETAELEGKFRKAWSDQIEEKGNFFKRIIFRTVPIHETIPNKNTVMPYDDVRKVVERAESISLAKCYCDLHRDLRGESTTEPLERCFLFGVYADYLIDKGFGRKVSSQEAIEVLNQCRDAGLVHNTTDLANPVFICNCPGYCVSNLWRMSKPGPFIEEVQNNNFYATIDSNLCTSCEECKNRCPLHAISMSNDGVAQINSDVCIGCGQCAFICPVEAATLKERTGSEHYTPITVHPNERSIEEYKADLEPYKDIIKRL